jgi:hypothetical protein
LREVAKMEYYDDFANYADYIEYARCVDYTEYCDGCVMDFYDLIDLLVKDIQHLETKTVYLRYTLSRLLPDKYDGEMLRCDIFHDLTRNHFDQPAYQRYISSYCGGRDPNEDEAYVNLLMRISRGKQSVGL